MATESNNNLIELFSSLAQSTFRSRFRLSKKEFDYLCNKGFDEIQKHARDFVTERLAPAEPKNDGKQTPMRNHPVFIAQHATATCCRKCLKKWHKINMGIPLTDEQIDYVVSVIMYWLKNNACNNNVI